MVKKIGNLCANQIYDYVKSNLISNGKTPHLAVVQVGNDPASSVYIKYKRRACVNMGFEFTHVHLPQEIVTCDLQEKIQSLNDTDAITGIIVQLPLPAHVDKFKILDTVVPHKDVDCFHTDNIGKMTVGSPGFVPATPMGIIYFLKNQNIETTGKCCVIIGKSSIVGRPLQTLLSNECTFKATTILCDKYTENIFQYTKMADILIVAAGKHHLINSADDIKQNAVVIDVGIHKVVVDGKTKLQGDVNYKALVDKCSVITPVPGGIGPITVACLMYNLAKPFLRNDDLINVHSR